MRRLALPLVLLLAAVVLGACSFAADGVRTVDAAQAVGELQSRTVIDVRTPAETDDGMITGALNIDLGAADFRDRVAALDREGSYLLYCRTGNRSTQAASIMHELGFSDVIDAGGYDDLAMAGAPTSP